MAIAIVDYGSGNLKSASKAFERASRESNLGVSITVTADADEVRKADRIVLPGVGAFADCKQGLVSVPGMLEVLQEKVIEGGVPFLGICVGMQLMATHGLEKSTTPGLNWIEGEVVKLQSPDPSYKIPQIGWNTLHSNRAHPLLDKIESGDDGYHAYFVHSYQFKTKNSADTVAVAQYGDTVSAMVAKDNMVGTQFHPEKSQTLGLAFISNFLQWNP